MENKYFRCLKKGVLEMLVLTLLLLAAGIFGFLWLGKTQETIFRRAGSPSFACRGHTKTIHF